MPHPKFTAWFNEQNIKNFTAAEFTSYFDINRRGVANSAPPEFHWKNILPTLRVVDRLRAHWNLPIVILSSFRSPAYNAAIDGAAKNSFHVQFKALDIVVAGKTPEQVFNKLLEWRNEGIFSGGLGKYNTFVHIDTRGYNATW